MTVFHVHVCSYIGNTIVLKKKIYIYTSTRNSQRRGGGGVSAIQKWNPPLRDSPANNEC